MLRRRCGALNVGNARLLCWRIPLCRQEWATGLLSFVPLFEHLFLESTAFISGLHSCVVYFALWLAVGIG